MLHRPHRFQPEYGDEQADAGRDCRTRLARPNSQARTGTGKYSFFRVQLTTSRIGDLIRLIHTLAICDDHTSVHTYIQYISAHRATVGPIKLQSVPKRLQWATIRPIALQQVNKTHLQYLY